MIIRKTVIIFIIVLCILMTGCTQARNASGTLLIKNSNGTTKLHMEPGTEHIVTCADAYQTETDVDPKVWGTEGDDYLSQLIIKYGFDWQEIKVESDHLIEVFFLLAKLYMYRY